MTSSSEKSPLPDPEHDLSFLVRRHLLVGWAGLVCFLLFGVVLEGFHAFKSPFYLDVENETRRLLWRLAHAHGALLSILQLGVASTFTWLGHRAPGKRAHESRAHENRAHENRAHENRAQTGRLGFFSLCFVASLLLLPSGFFFAGLGAVDGDPGFGILLVPGGAVCLLLGCIGLLGATLKAR